MQVGQEITLTRQGGKGHIGADSANGIVSGKYEGRS